MQLFSAGEKARRGLEEPILTELWSELRLSAIFVLFARNLSGAAKSDFLVFYYDAAIYLHVH